MTTTIKSDSQMSHAEMEAILAEVLPHLVNDAVMMVGKPIRLIFDPLILTASTDCQAVVNMSPMPFLEGRRNIGFGTLYHEGGHILWTPNGVELLTEARNEGGETRQHLLNLIMDRKDDILTAKDSPGFADCLRRRMIYIATMSLRQHLNQYDPRFARMSDAGFDKVLHNIKSSNPYEDFFYAAKWHKSPRLKVTHRAMRVIRNRRLLNASEDQLLWMAKRIHEILGEPLKDEDAEKQKKQVKRFLQLANISFGVEKGLISQSITPELAKLITNLIGVYLKSGRKQALNKLKKLLKKTSQQPGSISSGITKDIPVKKIPANLSYAVENMRLRREAEEYIRVTVSQLKRLDSPSEFTIYGQDDGEEIDLGDSWRIAAGLSPTYIDIIKEREIDAEIHLCLDCSGSMSGGKLVKAKQIAMVFSAAIEAVSPGCVGHLWAYSSLAVYDFGEVSPHSGIVKVEGEAGNSDTMMLKVVGQQIMRSPKKRKVVIVICDDGPDSVEEARKQTQQLLARGVIVVHILVGVHGTPDIYPVELLFSSMDDCLTEFGDLIFEIINNIR